MDAYSSFHHHSSLPPSSESQHISPSRVNHVIGSDSLFAVPCDDEPVQYLLIRWCMSVRPLPLRMLDSRLVYGGWHAVNNTYQGSYVHAFCSSLGIYESQTVLRSSSQGENFQRESGPGGRGGEGKLKGETVVIGG